LDKVRREFVVGYLKVQFLCLLGVTHLREPRPELKIETWLLKYEAGVLSNFRRINKANEKFYKGNLRAYR
jgi:hypothetical protein